jgi:hypothetical protein
MATVTSISNLNDDLDRTQAERVEREYGYMPFLARDGPDPRTARPVFGHNYLSLTKRRVQSLIEDSKTKISLDPEVRNHSRYIDLVMGRHWTGSAPSWRRRPVVNKLKKAVIDNLANTADLRFAIDILTNSTDHKFRTIADSLTKICQENFEGNDAIMDFIFAQEYASIAGLGYLKITRDREIRDITYNALGTDSVIEILPNVKDIQKSGGVIHRMMKPMSWFETYHSKVVHLIKPQRPPVDPRQGMDPLALGASTYYGWTRPQAGLGVGSLLNAAADQFSIHGFATEEGCIYDELHVKDPQINRTSQTLWLGYGNWMYKVEPGERIYPFGRMLAIAQESSPVILWDGPNMHWHAMYPFVRLRNEPVYWMLSGMSYLRDLVAINNPYNRVLGAALNLIEQAERPTVVTLDGSMPHEAWNNFTPGVPAGKIKLINRMKSILEQIQFIHPPVAALSVAIAILSVLDKDFAQQSGQGYGSKMASKKQVPGAEAVHQIQESEQGRYRLTGIFSEVAYKQCGRLVMSDAVQFYDPDKVVSVLGPDQDTWEYLAVDPGGLVPEDVRNGDFFKGHKFVNQFEAKMSPGSAMPAKRREQAQLAMALAAGGRMSMQTLYKKLNAVGAGLPDPNDEMKQIMLERSQGFAPAPPKGRGRAQQPGAAVGPEMGH